MIGWLDWSSKPMFFERETDFVVFLEKLF